MVRVIAQEATTTTTTTLQHVIVDNPTLNVTIGDGWLLLAVALLVFVSFARLVSSWRA